MPKPEQGPLLVSEEAGKQQTSLPIGAVVLAVMLVSVAIAGFVGIYVGVRDNNAVSAALALVYAVTASASAVGLFWRQPWAFSAFLLWGAAILLETLMFQLQLGGVPWAKFMAFLIIIGIVFYLLARYVGKVTR